MATDTTRKADKQFEDSEGSPSMERIKLAIDTIEGYGKFTEGQDGWAAILVLRAHLKSIKDASDTIGTDAGTLFIGRCKTTTAGNSWTYERVSESAISHRLQYGERWRLECLDANRVANRNADEVVRLQNAIESALRHHHGGFSVGHVLSDLSRVLIKPTPKEIVVGAETAVDLIAAERRRQVEAEGWTIAHDDQHKRGEIARAAACYALPNIAEAEPLWPWEARWNKRMKHDRKRQLVIAGALIVAEIERLQRAESSADKLAERAATIDERIDKLGSAGRPSAETMAMQFGPVRATTSNNDPGHVTSLQRDLAEARAERERLQSAVHELEEIVEQEDSRANENAREIHRLRQAISSHHEQSKVSKRSEYHHDRELWRAGEQSAPGPSDAKGEGAASSTPAEPAQKLVPLPEGVVAFEIVLDRPKCCEFWRNSEQDSWRIADHDWEAYFPRLQVLRKLDPAIYGVDAERVMELEAELAESKACEEAVDEHADKVIRERNALQSEVERLRKAIEEARGCIPLAKYGKAFDVLTAALTPPTATPEVSASGENNQTGEMSCQSPGNLPTAPNAPESSRATRSSTGHASDAPGNSPSNVRKNSGTTKTPTTTPLTCEPSSAPAAESEWSADKHNPFCDCPPCESRNALLEERDALSARLAACEERCRELEAGIERHHEDFRTLTWYLKHSVANERLWSLLAPKAEGDGVV